MHQQYTTILKFTPIKYPVQCILSLCQSVIEFLYAHHNTTPGYFKRYLIVVINVTSEKYELLWEFPENMKQLSSVLVGSVCNPVWNGTSGNTGCLKTLTFYSNCHLVIMTSFPRHLHVCCC